jgi:hypothetical protein
MFRKRERREAMIFAKRKESLLTSTIRLLGRSRKA